MNACSICTEDWNPATHTRTYEMHFVAGFAVFRPRAARERFASGAREAHEVSASGDGEAPFGDAREVGERRPIGARAALELSGPRAVPKLRRNGARTVRRT